MAVSGRGLAPVARIGRFPANDPAAMSRAMALLEGVTQKKAQSDNTTPPFTVTQKQTGTYNARAWDIARIDPTVAACFVVLPSPLDNLGAWVYVKYAAGAVNHTVTVSCVNATIDGDATFVLNTPRQIVAFYATTDGWERGSTL